MNKDKQRVAVAEACGWQWKDSNVTAFGATRPLKAWYDAHGKKQKQLPDYLNDLNVMHEAEKVLMGDQWSDYSEQLCGMCDSYCYSPDTQQLKELCHATASQRAEAFLRTLNKWEDS